MIDRCRLKNRVKNEYAFPGELYVANSNVVGANEDHGNSHRPKKEKKSAIPYYIKATESIEYQLNYIKSNVLKLEEKQFAESISKVSNIEQIEKGKMGIT